MDRIKIPIDKRCPDCNAWGIDWNDSFDRKLDQMQDTQGMSLYEAINRAKGSSSYQDDYWNCKTCEGTGVNSDKDSPKK